MLQPEQAKAAIKNARWRVLDILENRLGGEPDWPVIRAKIMKVFGRDGLERLFTETDLRNTESESNATSSRKSHTKE